MSTRLNKLHTLVKRLNVLPAKLKYKAITWFFGNKVKFVRIANIQIIALQNQTLTCFISNKKKVQNHIGGVHAAAMALLAESATGLITGLHLPDNKLPLLKSMHIDYVKRAKGSLTAIATITHEQIEQMKMQDKGEIKIHVVVKDEEQEQPIQCEMIWAWIIKSR